MNNKLLLINNGYPTQEMPQYTVYIKSIHYALVKAGFDVDLLVILFKKKGIVQKTIRYLMFLLELLIKPLESYNCIYINHAPFAIPIFLRYSFYKKRIAIHWHGNELISKTFFINITLSFLKPRIQGMCHIVPSIYFKKKLIELMDIDDDKIIISPSGGINTSLFIPVKQEKNNSKYVIGFASALSIAKGSNLLLELARKSSIIEDKLNKPIEINVIKYGNKTAEFIEKREEEKLPFFFHEIMSKEMMPNYYQSIDVLIMLSLRESLGLVVLEAMSCNIPVIAYNICAFPEFVIPGKTGELVNYSDDESQNMNSFINAIALVLNNLVDYKPRQIVLEKYSNLSVIEQYKELVNHL
jgi:glycosyltransferase involved in cell wall biosynthesis